MASGDAGARGNAYGRNIGSGGSHYGNIQSDNGRVDEDDGNTVIANLHAEGITIPICHVFKLSVLK